MIDISGQKFTRLTATSEAARNGYQRRWNCACDCGNVVVVAMNSLRMGRTRSCGCLSIETATARLVKHGLHGTPTYRTWRNMIARCHHPNSSAFKGYGALGIAVCDEWRASFQQFISDMGVRPDGTTIDRKNNDLGYSPDNCRWATPREQRMNQKRGTISLEQAKEVRRLHDAEGWSSTRIAKHLGISRGVTSGVIYLRNLASAES